MYVSVDEKVSFSLFARNLALAERVNGILKDEFLLGECLPSFSIARKIIQEAVEIYNNQRLHMSINYMTPAQKFAA